MFKKLFHVIFGCKWKYHAGYYRVCEKCGERRGGWGAMQLKPWDNWPMLDEDLRNHPSGFVNPDNYRQT